MPLQNRVAPTGEIIETSAHGLCMGNRGGRLHDGGRRLGRRRWVSKAWIACRLAFRERRRTVMGNGYTELFFLDEATALAAGHRPCFECRRPAFGAFQSAWAAGVGRGLPRAAAMDAALHAERCAVRGMADRPPAPVAGLPDGAFVLLDGDPFLVLAGALRRWRPEGYAGARPATGEAVVLTPASTLACLRAGYRPELHPSSIGDASTTL